jgi:hypothetical protein
MMRVCFWVGVEDANGESHGEDLREYVTVDPDAANSGLEIQRSILRIARQWTNPEPGACIRVREYDRSNVT